MATLNESLASLNESLASLNESLASLNESLASLNESFVSLHARPGGAPQSRAALRNAYLTCQMSPPVVLCSRMKELRIRIKFGEHEFEAEGPADSVERRAEAFQQMIAPPAPRPPVPESSSIAPEEKPAETQRTTAASEEDPKAAEKKAIEVERMPVEPEDGPLPTPLRLEQIMHMRGTILSLSVKARLQDALLVILLGQRNFRQNENVSGIEIMQGLRDSGFRVLRVDTLLTKLSDLGSVIVMGEHRKRRYRLSSSGAAQAEQIGRVLAAQLPALAPGVQEPNTGVQELPS